MYDNLEPLKGGKQTMSMGGKLGVTPVVGNPSFTSQFDLNISLVYLQNSDAGVFATEHIIEISPENLPSQAKVDVPVFLFGQADFNGGFNNNINRLSTEYYTDINYAIYNSVEFTHSLDGNIDTRSYPFSKEFLEFLGGRIQSGDLIIDLSPGDAVNVIHCYVIVSSKQIAYGTLLDSSGSDRFLINMIRYTIADTSKLSQYEKQLQFIEQSLFGKQTNDFVSPASYKLPSQFQSNLIDIPTSYAISKHTTIATYLNYDVGEILLSIFVSSQKKID